MGYYQVKTKHHTEAGRKDPRFVGVFDWARDMEYTVAQARQIAWETCYFMNLHPEWTKEQAIQKALE